MIRFILAFLLSLTLISFTQSPLQAAKKPRIPESEQAKICLKDEFKVSCKGVIVVDYNKKIERVTMD